MSVIVITGAAEGLGACIESALRDKGHYTIAVDKAELKYGNEKYICDLSDTGQVEEVCRIISDFKYYRNQTNKGPVIDALINCAGVNHLSYLSDLSPFDWDKTMNVNARAIALMTKGLLSKLIDSKGTVLNIISNASHMPMTASLAYNSSKAAAHMMTLQMARELTRLYGITVFGISPNRLRGTKMSKYVDEQVQSVRGWTSEKAESSQMAGLLLGEETDLDTLTEFICYLLHRKQNHKYLTGCIIPYGA